MRIYKFVIPMMLISMMFCSISIAEEYRQIRGVIQVHTNFEGSGAHSVDKLVTLAMESGIEFIIPTDHDLQVMEYGIFPFRNIVKKREERDSVIKLGPENYLALINKANQKQDEVLVIPGVQSSPFYYWTGSPFGDDFTANAYRKEMLLIGMQKPSDYLGLPLLHSSFSTRYTKQLMPRTATFLIAVVLSIYLIFLRRYMKIAGIVLLLLNLALMYNHHPFQSSLFDPYHGDQGVKPFQELIDYVNEKGGLTFWAHPESNYAVKGVQLGPAILKTPHYTDDVVKTKRYTGFEAIYGDTITMTDPGKQWDSILNDYCAGKRKKPIWGIAGADYHGDRKGEVIDEFQTVVIAENRTSNAILDALKNGRCYTLRKIKDPALVLEEFVVRNESSVQSAIQGGEIDVSHNPIILGLISSQDNGNHEISVSVVRGGKIIRKVEGYTPLSIELKDDDDFKGKTYYRLEVIFIGHGKLLSNPIFVSRA